MSLVSGLTEVAGIKVDDDGCGVLFKQMQLRMKHVRDSTPGCGKSLAAIIAQYSMPIALLAAMIQSGGCNNDVLKEIFPRAHPGVESDELLELAFYKVEGLQATIASSRLVVHRCGEARKGAGKDACWVYLIPEDAPLKVKGVMFTHCDELANSTRELINLLLSGTGTRIKEIQYGNFCSFRHEVGKDLVDSENVSVTRKERIEILIVIFDVRTSAGRYLLIEVDQRKYDGTT